MMYRNLIILGTVGALVGAGIVAAGSGDDRAAGRHEDAPARGDVRTTAPQGRGETGTTLARIVSSHGVLRLADGTTQVGECRPIAPSIADCTLRYAIQGGSIRAAGIVALDRTSLLSVDGGTGGHRSARGTVTMSPRGKGTLQLDHDVTTGAQER